ncbi:MAG: hypothetical protein IPP94_05365 [Ignavibacteria bacterium]|nr:hypothetical protein [Ignavibacteria bacterium]
MSIPKFESEWDGFKGHVAVMWDKINDEELVRIQGNFTELVALIAAKYGEQKQAVEQKLSELYRSYLAKSDDLQARSKAMADTIKQKAQEFQAGAKEKIQRIREESIEPVVQKSEDYIKVHPFSAVLGALGVGLLIGGLVGFLSRKD